MIAPAKTSVKELRRKAHEERIRLICERLFCILASGADFDLTHNGDYFQIAVAGIPGKELLESVTTE